MTGCANSGDTVLIFPDASSWLPVAGLRICGIRIAEGEGKGKESGFREQESGKTGTDCKLQVSGLKTDTLG